MFLCLLSVGKESSTLENALTVSSGCRQICYNIVLHFFNLPLQQKKTTYF